MSHKVNDNISLELGRRTAERLRLKPELRQIAVDNLDRWKRQNCKAPSLLACYDEWRKLLDQSLEDICAILTAENDESQRLRQNSPFAGVLSPQEVWEVKQRFRHAAGAA